MFGPGILELGIVFVVGLLVIGVPIAILILVVVLSRQNSADRSPRYSQLVDENNRLREEIAALKKQTSDESR